ncbi:hypothetical protein DFH28DRAFT_960592 [Melampsora americana]|nr:hypothetical protein DFH28DRAFT_960592 [Melampsora americana]
MDIWGPMVDKHYTSKPYVYNIILPNLHLGPKTNTHYLIHQIGYENQIKPGEIDGLRYKTASSGKSMVLSTCSKHFADWVQTEGIKILGRRVYGYRYYKYPEQCEKCLQMGHHYAWCYESQPLCAGCGEPHWSHRCTKPKPLLGREQCYVCIKKNGSSSSDSAFRNNIQRNC